MTLRSAPLRVSIYRRTSPGKSAYAEERAGWSLVATDVHFDVQLASGSVNQRPYGRVVSGKYAGFAPTGTDLRADDGVLVTASDELPAMVDRRFVVAAPIDWGARGGVQATLDDTQEAFEA